MTLAAARSVRRPVRMRLLTLLLLAFASFSVEARALEIGFNQGWVIGKWGRDLSQDFDATEWRRLLQRTRASGGSALRVWLCEGLAKEGVVWDGTRPLGLDPAFEHNVQRLIDLARVERVKLYWTIFDGNWPDSWPRDGVEAWRHYNVLSNKYGEGDLFRARILGPLVDLMEMSPDVTWGLDLMNEVQGSVRSWMWSDGWKGARRWIADWTAFVHDRAPGVRVTVSSGHHTSASDILAGRFDGLGLDFYDLHVYDDAGRIPRAWALATYARARGRPLVLGEFGQKSTKVDPALQARVTRRFLVEAARLGFKAAFAWRLEDRQSNGRHFTFWEESGAPREAVGIVRAFSER